MNSWIWGEDSSDEILNGVYAGSVENRGHLNVGQDFGCIHFQHQDEVVEL
jgi:hypothetical protein